MRSGGLRGKLSGFHVKLVLIVQVAGNFPFKND